ncbi:hypothetical protein LQZ24_03245 [Fructobacillus sp. M1-13]|uniref:Uncharacterized protein n=1 Tax=Fructobacillus papyriferae TaxID=2713171 RepID=A0ABS5QQU2_9LACO|nr:hypothetical protein [Fructobacillus papyriferae]MBS9335287.1 hypothetical protein [Fructobacillus papyriferae]MCD2159044.1 hypothetical protein [Fructobacillus papyriferae]
MFRQLKMLKPSFVTTMIVIVISLLSIQFLPSFRPVDDIIAATINLRGPVLISQTILLAFVMWQVVSFRKSRALIEVRGKTEVIQKQLIKAMTFEVVLYFLLFEGAFLLLGYQIFRDGPVVIGVLVLVFRVLLVWFLGLLLITMYNSSYPAVIALTVFVSNFLYHFIVEKSFLLVHYSVHYDTLWQAFNN